MKRWKLSDAKERFEEICQLAESVKPQLVDDKKRRKVVYVVSSEDYKGQVDTEHMSFEEFLLSIPKVCDDNEDLFERTTSI